MTSNGQSRSIDSHAARAAFYHNLDDRIIVFQHHKPSKTRGARESSGHEINVGTDVIHPIELGSTRNCHTLYTSHYRNNLIPQLKCGGSLHSETHVERDDLGLGAGVVSCAFLFACPANRDAGIGANEVNKCPTCTLAVTQIPNKATYTIMKQSLMLSPAQTKLNMIASMVKI
jgi:hypothetical protein